tara:strand:- start:5574 stop:6695 length:1122 start_codon:yes stop_codon:yes gene_type:complete
MPKNSFNKTKILYDARHIENVYSGLGRYTFSLLEALIVNNKYSSLEIILDSNKDYSSNPLFQKLNAYCNIKFKYLNAPLYKIRHHLILSNYVNKSDCDIYFYPHFDAPILIRNKKVIFVIHDLLPLVIEDYITKLKKIKQLYFKLISKINLIKKNTFCIAVSESTKKDIITHIYNTNINKIKVVYEDSFNISIDTKAPNKHIESILSLKYLFYIGDRRPHKNLLRMINIFRVLKQKYDYEGYFIIAGSEKNFKFDINSYVKADQHIKLIGKVSDKELEKLYANMQGLFFMSKYEGFGLPIIEAANHNKKIITSSNSSCGEIAPPSALLVDNKWNDEFTAKQCISYMKNTIQINNNDYLKNFSWNESVNKIFMT